MKDMIGLYGGTFDPPHLAHISVAKAFLKAFPTARLIVMPCLIPPHKTRLGGADDRQRLEMARICFEGLERTTVSDFELKQNRTSYTYLTVMALREQFPDRRICLIMGQDNLDIFEKWREYRYLLENCTIAAAVRGKAEISPAIDRLRSEHGADIRLLPMKRQDISSTEIREGIAQGKGRRFLTKEVYEYIKKEGLYL